MHNQSKIELEIGCHFTNRTSKLKCVNMIHVNPRISTPQACAMIANSLTKCIFTETRVWKLIVWQCLSKIWDVFLSRSTLRAAARSSPPTEEPALKASTKIAASIAPLRLRCRSAAETCSVSPTGGGATMSSGGGGEFWEQSNNLLGSKTWTMSARSSTHET